jgi:hypothetical protein
LSGGERIYTSTVQGTIEIWETSELGSGACRINVIDVKAHLAKFTKKLILLNNEHGIGSTCESVMSDVLDPSVHVIERDDGYHESQQGEQTNFIPLNISPIVTSFHFICHDREGTSYVTMNHAYDQGCWLVLWTKGKEFPSFEITSVITLPITSRRKPCIHFDGRRLVVLGQDHIGMIILVYQVVNSVEKISRIPRKSYRKGDECAGVRNVFQEIGIEFVNRIRHVALGGMQYFDSAFMTVNERFIIINTKSGNLLQGISDNLNEGILLIDLEDHCIN